MNVRPSTCAPVPGRQRAYADAVRFALAWARNPRDVAAVAPSSRALAALITRGLGPSTGPVLELGPGTGVFTQALVDRGVAERDLTLVEYDPHFARLLAQRFPTARVVRMDAAALAELAVAGEARFGAIVCGLGLLNMDRAKVRAILAGSFAQLRPDGVFQLFTYGRRCSVPEAILAELGLVATRVGRTLRNVPPASVYRIVRERPENGCAARRGDEAVRHM